MFQLVSSYSPAGDCEADGGGLIGRNQISRQLDLAHVPMCPLAKPEARWQYKRMSKVQTIEAELQTLSPDELRQVRVWLDDILEDELEFTGKFEAKIRASEQDMAAAQPAIFETAVA